MIIKAPRSGQALTMLLIFVVIAIIITSSAAMVLLINLTTTSKNEQGILAYEIAESGAENAVLRLLRNPNYVGETLQIGSGSATIQVSGSSTKTIVSQGYYNSYTRKIQITAQYTNNILTITSWKEIQ